MATKPFKSEWEWLNINRGIDYSVIDGEQLKRNNWVLTRFRWSNEIYVSELGNRESSLTAYNGGVPETVSGSTSILGLGVRFLTATVYTPSDKTWVEIAGESGRYKLEGSGNNIPDSTKVNILSNLLTQTGVTPQYAWCIIECDADDIENGIFPNRYDDVSYSNKVRATETDNASRPPIDGVTILASTAVGTFNTGTQVDTTADEDVFEYEVQGAFLCTADNQNYSQRGVEWYQQVQTWSFKDDWVPA